MRPAGEISMALLAAAQDLVRVDVVGGEQVLRGPTLQELAHHACVGLSAARNTVANLRRAGKLVPVTERKVDYRNRPVVEYAPAQAAKEDEPFFDVASVFNAWARS